MSDTSVIPASLSIRNLFEDLLGRDVNVSPGDPMVRGRPAPPPCSLSSPTRRQQLYAVLGMQLSARGQRGRRPGSAAARRREDSIEEKKLFPNLAENVFELCNVLTSLLNREGGPHVKLYQVIYPGRTPAERRPGAPARARPPAWTSPSRSPATARASSRSRWPEAREEQELDRAGSARPARDEMPAGCRAVTAGPR